MKFDKKMKNIVALLALVALQVSAGSGPDPDCSLTPKAPGGPPPTTNQDTPPNLGPYPPSTTIPNTDHPSPPPPAEPTCSSEVEAPNSPNIDTPPPPPPSLNQDGPPAEPTCTSTPDAPTPPPPPPPPPPPVQPNIEDPTLSYGKQPTYGSGQTPYDQLPLCVDVDTTKFTPHNVTEQEYAKIAGGSSTGSSTSTASITGMDGLGTASASATGTETSTGALGVPEPLQGQSANKSGASSISVHAFSALSGIVTAWFFALQ